MAATAMAGMEVAQPFHATEDQQDVRNRVFDCLRSFDFRVDTTVLEKAKAKPEVRRSQSSFYKLAWYLHLKYVAPRITRQEDGLLIVAAKIGTHKDRTTFSDAVSEVVAQACAGVAYRPAFWASVSDPFLWVVDYCSWAIQRKWERGDGRSYDLIKDRIKSEFDAWGVGTQRYY